MSKSLEAKLEKYKLTDEDFNTETFNSDLIQMKKDAQTTISAFIIIENTLTYSSPEESEIMDKTLDHLLECIKNNYEYYNKERNLRNNGNR